MIRDFLTNPTYLALAAWLAVVMALVAITPQVSGWIRALRGRWQERTALQSSKDRKNYQRLLDQYRGYLDVLENLIIMRSQAQRGKDGFTPEMRQKLVEMRDDVYNSLEKRGDREEDMGTLQKLDVLEERMVGIAEQRRHRTDLEARQAEIEDHPVFRTL